MTPEQIITQHGPSVLALGGVVWAWLKQRGENRRSQESSSAIQQTLTMYENTVTHLNHRVEAQGADLEKCQSESAKMQKKIDNYEATHSRYVAQLVVMADNMEKLTTAIQTHELKSPAGSVP